MWCQNNFIFRSHPRHIQVFPIVSNMFSSSYVIQWGVDQAHVLYLAVKFKFNPPWLEVSEESEGKRHPCSMSKGGETLQSQSKARAQNLAVSVVTNLAGSPHSTLEKGLLGSYLCMCRTEYSSWSVLTAFGWREFLGLVQKIHTLGKDMCNYLLPVAGEPRRRCKCVHREVRARSTGNPKIQAL